MSRVTQADIRALAVSLYKALIRIVQKRLKENPNDKESLEQLECLMDLKAKISPKPTV